LILSFVAACTFWLLFFTSSTMQHDRVNGSWTDSEPIWVLLLALAFVLIPYVVSFGLVCTRRVKSIAAGAGVAAGFFSIIVLVSPHALLGMFVIIVLSAWDKPQDPGLLAAAVVLLVFLAISVWIVWSALRIAKIRWSTFLIAACATVLYVFVGSYQVFFAMTNGERQVQRRKEQADLNLYMPGVLARQRLVSLTACLLRSHMQHPEAGYPASLEPPPSGWTCDTQFGKSAMKEFTFNYAPQTDARSGLMTDFRLVAIPNAKGVNNRNPMMTDSRGIVFVYYPWEMENARAEVMVMSSDRSYSQIDQLKSNIEQYANAKNAGTAPAKLDSNSMGSLGYEIPSIEDGGMRLVTRDFEVIYFSPSPAQKRFALSARCKSYGQNCLRSFFLDAGGVIHGTGEPRQATADDPPSPLCERVSGKCSDVSWSVP
jgi:hypothetical protein